MTVDNYQQAGKVSKSTYTQLDVVLYVASFQGFILPNSESFDIVVKT
jgi:hypothetical protein